MSLDEPHHLEPADDSGSDTAARFHYQAEVMFPYCLACALGDDIECVVAEHFEDIAVRQNERWRFIQVKSRNATLPPWTLHKVLEPGGALHTLFRTYQHVKDLPASLEMLLEGPYSTRDAIRHLVVGQSRDQSDLVEKVARTFDVKASEALPFLERVTLLPTPPSRAEIKNANLTLLHEQQPTLPHNTVLAIYSEALKLIEHAIRAESMGWQWPSYLFDPATAPAEYARKLALKTLSKERLERVFNPLKAAATSPLVVRLTAHVAHFKDNPTLLFFVNVTNLSLEPISITHVWYQHGDTFRSVLPQARPLPKELGPKRPWSTWLPVIALPPEQRQHALDKFKIRLSTGEIFSSRVEDTVPPKGKVPDGSNS